MSVERAIRRLRHQRDRILRRSEERGHDHGNEYVVGDADYGTVQHLADTYRDFRGISQPTPCASVMDIIGDNAAEHYREVLDEEGLDCQVWAMAFLEGAFDRWKEFAAEVEK
jgi:hypothetical protein